MAAETQVRAELLSDRVGTGSGWVTLADPEGNQFCVLRSHSESGSAN